MWLSVVFAFALGIGLFFLLPNFLIGLIKDRIVNDSAASSILANLYEGIIRIVIFLVYILLISNMHDIKRVFAYHGAEHKTIHCYESGKALEPKNARKFSRLHPRCGTSFLLIVMVVSILFFSFIAWNNPLQRLLYRLLLLPIIAGVSYEIIRFAGKHDNIVTRIISAPGMWLQRLTTYEPDDSQIEVAIAALKAVIDDN